MYRAISPHVANQLLVLLKLKFFFPNAARCINNKEVVPGKCDTEMLPKRRNNSPCSFIVLPKQMA